MTRTPRSAPRPGRREGRPGLAGAFGLALALGALLALAPAASATPPSHPPLPDPIGAFPLNHACGTTVDSEGDIYVSNAGEAKVEVFDPSGAHLTSVEVEPGEPKEPCGLAVDTRGTLFVVERDAGNVVRYVPDEYPFSGTPTYGPPEVIDGSGNAKGIAVDTVDDSLYVAEGDHISVYDPEGNLGIDEVQRVLVFEATGGTFKLSFEGQETSSLPWNATHAEVQAALEALSTIGAGNVSVTQGPNEGNPRDHLVTFKGPLGRADLLSITADTSNLTGGENKLLIFEYVKGFDGHIGAGNLTDATGVAAYTYRITSSQADRYLFAADAAGDEVKIFSGGDIRALKLRKTIEGVDEDGDPETPDQELGFGEAGAYLAVDPGNGNPVTGKCEEPVDAQACTAGHLLVYDDAHGVVDELEASGEFLDQLTSPAFADAKPTGLAIDRSGKATDGRIYIAAGEGSGAKLLAFDPLAAPSRPPLEKLSENINGDEELKTARAVATDSAGNVYVAAGSLVHVFSPKGEEIKVGPKGEGIPIAEPPTSDLAVDSACNVYVLVNKGIGSGKAELEKQKVQYYSPVGGTCPPKDGTQYSGPVTVADGNSFETPSQMFGIGLNPANDHLFVSGEHVDASIEFDSAGPGHESKILDPCFACGLSPGRTQSIAVYGRNGNVYMAEDGIRVIDPTGSEVLARITGASSPAGKFIGGPNDIDVDQSNGHVLAFDTGRGAGEEYDSAGAFVSAFGEFTPASAPAGIAIDNSGGPGDGNVYIAYDDDAPNTFDLTAFGPLNYGEPPIVVTGTASGVGGGKATLNGTVDPSGVEIEACEFEYLTDVQYIANGKTFAGATTKPCFESPAEIGQGAKPVPVHADISGLDPQARYRFRLIAENKYGEEAGDPGLFGPPLLEPQSARPVLYGEAILRAEIDPSGLATTYRFEYLTEAQYLSNGGTFAGAQSTPTSELPPGDGYSAVETPLTGLAEGTTYRFRILVENEAKPIEGPDQTFTTLERLPPSPCTNAEYRTGLSAGLPDCRAYELVTPAETRGGKLYVPDPGTAGGSFNMWLAKPRGEGGGESLIYAALTTLPGFEGTGSEGDTYHAKRAPGAHPEAGWSTELFSPTFTENGGETAKSRGIAEEQRYGFFSISGQGALEQGVYLRTPAGFEMAAKGTLGADPLIGELANRAPFVGPGGAHVVFFSDEHLEPKAAPQGTESLYDRAAGSSSAEVVSVKPDGSAFDKDEDANYVATTEDGSGVIFRVGGTLYLHHVGATDAITAAPNAFAGVSPDASRVYYAAGGGSEPSDLFACDTQAGACVGAEAPGRTRIAEDSIFVNVSPDGSHAFFTSEEALTGAEENEAGETAQAGEPNLYVWDGVSTRFLAVLDPSDVGDGSFGPFVGLGSWTKAISAGVNAGRNRSPTRSTPDGEVLVFQSHARLTAYDNEGLAVIYRYDSAAPAGEAMVCVSCDPSGAPPGSDAQLLDLNIAASVTAYFGLVPNVTDDGQAVFFQSFDRLLPEDANEAEDVYEWLAPGRGGCKRPGGCLALISTGQGERPSYLYSMSADGSDVFFSTPEKLVAQDIPGSFSLYDARIEGGIPSPPEPIICHGDACQGPGSSPPALPAPGDETRGAENEVPRGRCAKLSRQAKRLSAQAKRLRRAAHRADNPKRAAAMRRSAARLADHARGLNQSSRRCRRAEQRASR